MKSIKRIEAENPTARVICTHIFVTMVKSNPNRYNKTTGYGAFHNGEDIVPISIWREDMPIDDPAYEAYPYVLWFDKR